LKHLSILLLAAVTVILSSATCIGVNPHLSYCYSMEMSFIDSKGNDLLEPLYISNKEFIGKGNASLWIVLQNSEGIAGALPDTYPDGTTKFDGKTFFVPGDYLSINKYDNSNCTIWKALQIGSEQEKLLYELICPKVFNDENKHTIETYWEMKDGKPWCNKVIFEGNEYTPSTQFFEIYSHHVDIIVNRNE
jgi:hypothetical protein